MSKDQILKCQSCQQDFAFTQEEQNFYCQKHLKPPVFCPICRSALKTARQDKFRGRISR